jgi:hypothetical protein
MLSVFLITCNEEATLAAALGSVKPIADELIVVDTGSSDRTAAIARECGAAVYPFTWNDDFSAARNFAVSKTTGDWVLCIDADEQMLPGSCDVVRACMDRADALGFTVRWQNLVRSGDPDSFTEMQPVRLFRRINYARFTGRIHEHLDPPIEEIMRREGKRIFQSDIILRHTGYVQEKSRAKLQRAVHLLKLELQDRPGQLYYMIEYGRTLLQLGDSAGHGQLAEAARRVWALRDQPRPPLELAAALLEYSLSAASLPASNPITPSAARYLAQRWFPESPPLLWLLAQQAFGAKDFTQAALFLEKLVECGKSGRYDQALSFDPRILGDDAVLNLGACYLRLSKLDDAERCFRQIEAASPRAAEARQNLAVVASLKSDDLPGPRGKPTIQP